MVLQQAGGFEEVNTMKHKKSDYTKVAPSTVCNHSNCAYYSSIIADASNVIIKWICFTCTKSLGGLRSRKDNYYRRQDIGIILEGKDVGKML